MSLDRTSNQGASSAQHATQVNWKIFELQSCLLGEKVHPEYLNICKKWFAPQHFADIVEERSTEGRCGYPLCDCRLARQASPEKPAGASAAAGARSPTSTRLSLSSSSSNSAPSTYCSQVCTIKASDYMKALDPSAPITRDVAKTLKHNPSVEQRPEIDDLLNAMVGGSTGRKPSASSSSSYASITGSALLEDASSYTSTSTSSTIGSPSRGGTSSGVDLTSSSTYDSPSGNSKRIMKPLHKTSVLSPSTDDYEIINSEAFKAVAAADPKEAPEEDNGDKVGSNSKDAKNGSKNDSTSTAAAVETKPLPVPPVLRFPPKSTKPPAGTTIPTEGSAKQRVNRFVPKLSHPQSQDSSVPQSEDLDAAVDPMRSVSGFAWMDPEEALPEVRRSGELDDAVYTSSEKQSSGILKASTVDSTTSAGNRRVRFATNTTSTSTTTTASTYGGDAINDEDLLLTSGVEEIKLEDDPTQTALMKEWTQSWHSTDNITKADRYKRLTPRNQRAATRTNTREWGADSSGSISTTASTATTASSNGTSSNLFLNKPEVASKIILERSVPSNNSASSASNNNSSTSTSASTTPSASPRLNNTEAPSAPGTNALSSSTITATASTTDSTSTSAATSPNTTTAEKPKSKFLQSRNNNTTTSASSATMKALVVERPMGTTRIMPTDSSGLIKSATAPQLRTTNSTTSTTNSTTPTTVANTDANITTTGTTGGIEGYVPVLGDIGIKVAPATTLRNLSFDPFARPPPADSSSSGGGSSASAGTSTKLKTRSTVGSIDIGLGIGGNGNDSEEDDDERAMTAEDARIWNELFNSNSNSSSDINNSSTATGKQVGCSAVAERETTTTSTTSATTNNAMKEEEEEAAQEEDEESGGWFVTLWSALEDLFDYDCIMELNERSDALTPTTRGQDSSSINASSGAGESKEDEEEEEDEEEDADEDGGIRRDGAFVSTSALANSRAIRQMLNTGIAVAEDIVFSIFRKLSDNERDRYNRIKNKLISRASIGRSGGVASLTSTQWSFIGLVLVDNIARRIYNTDMSTSRFGDAWNQVVRAASDRILMPSRANSAASSGRSGLTNSSTSNTRSSNTSNSSSTSSGRAVRAGRVSGLDESEIEILRNFFQG